MREENYLFYNKDKFVKKARELRIDDETIDHELDHYREARRLGYKTRFKINQYQNICSVIINKNVRDEDVIRTALAPKHPDFTDFVIAEEAKIRLRRKNAD